MFLRSRLQLSSPFKLIPKPPCSGEKNLPALENARKFVARWVWSIYLPQDVALPNSEWAHCWEAAPAFLCGEPVQGRCLVAEGSADWQGLGDLSCMQKSNHAAPALGYYFSTWGCKGNSGYWIYPPEITFTLPQIFLGVGKKWAV